MSSKPRTKSRKKAARPAPRKPAFEPRISFVTLGVRNLKRMTEFYRDALGLPVHLEQNDVAMFALDGIILGLYPMKLLAKDAGQRAGLMRGFGSFALAHNVRRREDVDGVLRTVAERGARILKPAHDAFWGGRSGYFADPENNPWEVAWNPFIKLDAKGRLKLETKPKATPG